MVKKRLSHFDQAKIMIQLGGMIENGFTIIQALTFIKMVFPRYREKINMINHHLENGETLSSALIELGISQNILDQLAMADAHGNFAKSLINFGKMLQYRNQQFKKILQLLSYPFFLLIMLGGLQWGLKVVGFSEITDNSKLNLNTLTNGGLYLIIVFFLFCLICFYLIQHLSIIKQLQIANKIPLIGKIFCYYYHYLVMFDLTLFVNNGFSINQMIEICQTRPKKSYLYQISFIVKQDILKGKSLISILQYYSFFPPELSQIITKGVGINDLKIEFAELSKVIFQKLVTNIEKIINKIQPLMFIFVGICIIIVYLNILLPVFEMMKGI